MSWHSILELNKRLMPSYYAEITLTLEEEKLKLKQTLLVRDFGKSQYSETTD